MHHFDAVVLGRCIHAARDLAGIHSLRTLASQMTRMGVPVTATQLRSFESGAVIPTCDIFIGLVVVLRPPGGVRWFWRAWSDDTRNSLKRLWEA